MYLHDVVTVGHGGRKGDFRQEGCLLGFFHYGIDGIFQQAHDRLAQLGRVALQRHGFGGQGEHRVEVVLLLLLGENRVEHLFALLQHGQQVHIRIASRPVFQQLFHRLQYEGGVLAVLLYVLEVFPQHAEHVLRVGVVILVDGVLVEFNVFPEVFQQVVRHLREVDDIVHRVEDAVDESFCQFTHRRHLLLTDQFVLGGSQVGSSLLHDFLQFDFFLFQSLQPVAEQQIDEPGKEYKVEQYHIPSHQQGVSDTEADRSYLRQLAVGQKGLYTEGVRTV